MNKRMTAGVAVMAMVGVMLVTNLSYPGMSAGTRGVAESVSAIPVATGPTVDGLVDTLWSDAQALTTSNGVTIKAAYTSTDLYLLLTWSDTTKDDYRKQWSWNGVAGEWSQASNNEDRLGIAWNLGDSTASFDTEGCQILCHIPTDPSKSVMATNAPGERIDFWHWKATRSNPDGWADDQWLNDTRIPDTDPMWTTDPDGAKEAAHHGDAKTSGGYSDNKQTLNNGTADIDVPKYWEPGAAGDDAVYITQAEIDAGEAKLIVSVDAANVLTDEDANTVPITATMPGYTVSRPVGSRGDIAAGGVWASDTWTVELQRALNTGNSDDAQFTDTSESASYAFGVARYDNAGGMSHVTSGSNAYQLVFEQPNLPPTGLQISKSIASPKAGDEVTFSGSATDPEGGALTYAWDFGDGATGTGAEVAHTYSEAGTYTVTLTVSDGVNDPEVTTTQVTVAEKPAAGLDVTLIAAIVILIIVILAIIGYVMMRRKT